MRETYRSFAFIIPVAALGFADVARATVVALTPVADSFVDSALPSGNFGGGGAEGISDPSQAHGEFQSLLRFDTTSAIASFNSSFGVGQWTVQSITLRLTAAAPNNAIFNAQAAGQFAAGWMQNDSWVEGTGTPMAPGTTGITFATLPGFLSGADETLGSFAFDGSTTASATYTLSLTSGFLADASAGGLVSLRLFDGATSVSYLFNSRTFGTVASRPELDITAVPGPAGISLLMPLGAMAALRRRRRV